MSKELETLEKLVSFAFVMSENMIGLTKGNYDENQFIKKTYEYLHKYNVDAKSQLELENALKRLEAIDNAEPSEALGLAKRTCELYADSLKQRNLIGYDIIEKQINEALDTIKQALLKTQEQEKENELLKEIIKSLFDRGCPLHQYTDKDGMLLIEVDNECSTMHLGKFKGVDLDAKLKEVLE